jgi:hypothetical protein
MNAIQVYIWGVRYGFTEGSALFPERNKLTETIEIQHYDTICRNFTRTKDAAFRTRQRDFYFLMQDQDYQIYSLVDKSHQDVGKRETYLVYSIVCPKSNIISGNIKEGLQNLKTLYKTRNSDPEVRTNMFTNDQIRNAISNLTLSTGQVHLLRNNSIYYFQNETEINLNNYIGHEVYLMHTGGDPEFSTHLNLSVQQLNLGQINQENQNRLKSVAEFRTLLNSKTNFQKANELYSTISSTLGGNERTSFESWKSEEKGKIELVNLKNLIDQYSKNRSKDIAPCENLIAQNKSLIDGLNETEKSLLSQWRDQIEKNKKLQYDTLITDIEFEINNAKELNFSNSITAELEAKLNKQTIENLSDNAKSNLKKWREHHHENTIISDVTALYSEIKKLDKNNDRRAILSRQKDWNNKIDGFAERLKGKSPFQGESLEKYKYLYDRKWQRKERPIAKIAVMAFVAIALTGGGFFAAMNWLAGGQTTPPNPNPDPAPAPRGDGEKTVVTSVTDEMYTDFEYKGNTYLVETSLLTEAGSKYNTNKRFYRFLNNKWEMREEANDANWKPATPIRDIPLILTKWDTKFRGEEAKKKADLAQANPQTPATQVTTPPETKPPVTNPVTTTPPKDDKPPKVTKPPTEIPKVTPPKKTLTAAERAAIYREIEKDVKAGSCDRDCILKRCTEAQIDADKVQKLYTFL